MVLLLVTVLDEHRFLTLLCLPETLSGGCGCSPSILDTNGIPGPSVAGIMVSLGSTSSFFCSALLTFVSLAIPVLKGG